MKKIIFGKIGDSFFDVHFYTDEKPQCPDGFVIMKSERPIDGDYIANADGEWVIDNSKIIASNESKQKQLLNEANGKIAVLQDSIDLNMQEDDEEAQLKQWKKYRILLTRIDTSDVNAVFPEKPIKAF